jgi:hypothetical protein
VRQGTIRPQGKQTVGQAAVALLEGMRDGTLLDRSGNQYKPSTCRSYEQAVRRYLAPDPLARLKVSAVQRPDIQDYVDRLRRSGLAAGTIANKLDPIRVIFRRAIKRGEITVDPTKGLELPAIRGRRERSPTAPRRRSSSPPCRTRSVRSGRPRSTAGCDAASCVRCGGPTSSSTPARR